MCDGGSKSMTADTSVIGSATTAAASSAVRVVVPVLVQRRGGRLLRLKL